MSELTPDTQDEFFMSRALQLASLGRFTTTPNPKCWMRDCA
jgi:pyrimidine deaminase RibD-like protein